tara:strand:- start:22104 stop:22406 length:303 start_codon:yes stop_codon:yes gene_type:complete
MNFKNEDKAEVLKTELEVRDQEINELKEVIESFRQQDNLLQKLVNTLTQQNNELVKNLKQKDKKIEELKDRLQDALLTFNSDTDNEYLKTYKSYHLKLHL